MPIRPEEIEQLAVLAQKTNDTMDSLSLTIRKTKSYLEVADRLMDDSGEQILSELRLALKQAIEALNAILGAS